MLSSVNKNKKNIYKLVLTGGPCAGKTTAMARLSTFFSDMGWKVYCVPETATVLLSGGITFPSLHHDEIIIFQENLLMTILQIEKTFLALAESCDRDVLIIHDRGFMDGTAFLSNEDWAMMKKKHNWEESELRDKRYDHVVHLVTAAVGAEPFYSLDNNAKARTESLEAARGSDQRCQNAWLGHPYYDVIDNSGGVGFEQKIQRLMLVVCNRMGVDSLDRLNPGSVKRKWLVRADPIDGILPEFRSFTVTHTYLISGTQEQGRIRKRTQNGFSSYQHTVRYKKRGQTVELKNQIVEQEYRRLLYSRDSDHYTVVMQRRCFVYNYQHFQLDTYIEPMSCDHLVLLYTYTDKDDADIDMPPFLDVEKEVTHNPEYSMFNLTTKPSTRTNNTTLARQVSEQDIHDMSDDDVCCIPGNNKVDDILTDITNIRDRFQRLPENSCNMLSSSLD